MVRPTSQLTEPNFDISTSGPVTFVEEQAPCGGYRITGTADAAGTHIGDRATFATNECAQPNFQTGVNQVDGQAVVTATDGDQIFIHYHGQSPAPLPKEYGGDGSFHDDLSFDITGGTGRFADASGGGRLTADGNIYDVPTVVKSRLQGTIAMRA
jgi:hypothetical protein